MSQERSRLFRSAKTGLSLVLGLLMFTFGFLKFVNPTIDRWFHVQIQQSHLPHSALLMGKIAEIMTRILFMLIMVPADAVAECVGLAKPFEGSRPRRSSLEPC